MKNIDNFESWKNKLNESSDDELNEFLGLGKLVKSFFKSLTGPVQKKVQLITKNIDDKTGKVKDSKALVNELVLSFKLIADDKKADLKGTDGPEDVKKILKEFITEVKAVFAAARVPFNAMVESEELDYEDSLNEDLKSDFVVIMTKSSPEDFETYLDMFLDDWIKEKDQGDLKELEKESIKFIDTMMKTFETKIKNFGPQRLQSLITLVTKDENPKKEDIKKILSEKPSTEDSSTETEVKTDDGKDQFFNAIKDNYKSLEMDKVENEDGSFDILIKGVKID